MGVAGLAARNHVVGTVTLVGGNEVRVVDAGQGRQSGHLLPNLVLQRGLEDLGTVHGIGHVHRANVPAADDEVIGVNHGEDLVEGDVDIFLGVSVGAQLHCGAHEDGAIVVGLLSPLTGLPGEAAAVGDDGGGDGGAVVATPADKHDTELGDLAVDLEVVNGVLGRGHELAIGTLPHIGGVIGVAGLDLGVGVSDVGRVDGEQLLGGSRGGGSDIESVRGARVDLGVGSHVDEGDANWQE